MSGGPKRCAILLLSAWAACAAVRAADASGNLLANGSFELPGPPWQVEPAVADHGSLALSENFVKSGRTGLLLIPNSRNVASTRLGSPFGVGQGIVADGLRGRWLYLSTWVLPIGEASGIVRIYAISRTGQAFAFQEMRQKSGPGPVRRRDLFFVPDNPEVAYLVIGCLVEGTSGAVYFEDVALTDRFPADWLEAAGAPDFGDAYPAAVVVKADRWLRHIPATLYGANLEWPWDGNGVWDSAQGALNPAVVDLARELGTTLYRFPGGVFSDFYRWREGVGPQGLRPVTPILPGDDPSPHSFGTDEALAFSEATNAGMLITVNVVTGTAEEAADWVRYVNSGPRRVEYWEIGNESYVAGQAPYVSQASLTPEEYAARFLEFARAMRAADPSIKLGAIADENYSRAAPRAYPDWTERVLAIAGPEIDFLSVHCGYAPMIDRDLGWNPRTVYSAMLASPLLIRDQLGDLSRRVAAALPERASPIPIAVTEWGPFFQFSAEGRFTDHTKTLGSALYAASALKAFIESGVEVANLFTLVDSLNIAGWLGTHDGGYVAKAPAFALKLFTHYFGTELVESLTAAPSYDSPSVGWVDSVAQVPYLETVASTSSDGRRLYILAINKHFDRPARAAIAVTGFGGAQRAQAYTLTGSALDANTGTRLPSVPGVAWTAPAEVLPGSRILAGGPQEIGIYRNNLDPVSSPFHYTFPPHSVTVIVLGE